MNLQESGSSTGLLIFQDHSKFQRGDQFVAYFEKNGVNYLCGLVDYMDNIANKMLLCYNNTEGEENFNGVPGGDVIRLGLIRNNIIYEMNAGTIVEYNGGTNPQKDVIKAIGVGVYHIKNLVVTNKIVTEIRDIPWIQYYNSLCPQFEYSQIDRTFQVNFIREGIRKHKDGRQWKTYALGFFSNMKVWRVPVYNAKSQILSIIEGSGRIVGDKYYFNKEDYARGYIILSWTATPKAGCTNKTSPSCMITYNFTTLPPPEITLVPI